MAAPVGRYLPVLAWVAVGFLAIADATRRVDAQGPLTVVVAALAGLQFFEATTRGPDRVPGRVLPPVALLAFTLFAWLTLATTPDRLLGLQNALLYAIFTLTIAAAAASVHRWPPLRLLHAYQWAGVVAAVIYLAGVASFGPNTNEGLFTARAAAGAMAVPFVTALVFAVREGGRRWPALVIGLGIASTLSRGLTATVLVVAVLVIASRAANKVTAVFKLLAAAGAGLLLVRYAYQHYEPFRLRFEQGDGYKVGDFTLGSSGRDNLWSATVDHWGEKPWLGHGVGSAEHYIFLVYPPNQHPHNDYLRILHDFGIVGLVLFALGVVALAVHGWRGYRAAAGPPGVQTLHLAALAGLLFLLLEMIPDNPVTAIFVMLPLAVLIGASWGHAPKATSLVRPTSGRASWSAPTSR